MSIETINTKFRKVAYDVEAIQFRYAEYADNPLVFDAVPDWLHQAIDTKEIEPVFQGEDYWYLRLRANGGTVFFEPGDWIVRTSDGSLWRLPNAEFVALYEPIPAAVPAVTAETPEAAK